MDGIDWQALRAEWEPKLPFLDWSDNPNGGVRISRDRTTGTEGYRCKDGSVVRYDDPRVVEYAIASFDAVRGYVRDIAKEIYQHVVTAPEPFSMDYVLKRPDFIRWLNTNGDDCVLSIAEYRLLGPAYQERIRRLREAAAKLAPGAPSTAGDPPALQEPRLTVSLERKAITLDGQVFDVASDMALRWVKVLAMHPGEWIPAPQLKDFDPLLDGTRTDKLIARLPKAVALLIDSQTGKGSRLNSRAGAGMP